MISDLNQLEWKLGKRGFRLNDSLLHPCTACGIAQGVRRYSIVGKAGGRQIDLCQECGVSRSWRTNPGAEERSEEDGFDLHKFLG
ncbi:MAG TPA: hypothetical protein VGM88_24055 [Kofleriaceae bacterium]|jgi:hypothetical protein